MFDPLSDYYLGAPVLDMTDGSEGVIVGRKTGAGASWYVRWRSGELTFVYGEDICRRLVRGDAPVVLYGW